MSESCKLNDLTLHATISGEDYGKSELRLIDYRNGTWNIRIGNFAFSCEARATTEDIRKVVRTLDAMLLDFDLWEAAQYADYETDPKADERNVEAWLEERDIFLENIR